MATILRHLCRRQLGCLEVTGRAVPSDESYGQKELGSVELARDAQSGAQKQLDFEELVHGAPNDVSYELTKLDSEELAHDVPLQIEYLHAPAGVPSDESCESKELGFVVLAHVALIGAQKRLGSGVPSHDVPNDANYAQTRLGSVEVPLHLRAPLHHHHELKILGFVELHHEIQSAQQHGCYEHQPLDFVEPRDARSALGCLVHLRLIDQ